MKNKIFDVTIWNFVTHFIYQQQQQATHCTHLAQNTLHYTTYLTYTQTRAAFQGSSSTTYHRNFQQQVFNNIKVKTHR